MVDLAVLMAPQPNTNQKEKLRFADPYRFTDSVQIVKMKIAILRSCLHS